MPRWESDARGRLERAALELFEAQGFEPTAVAQIARAAGLTERSFYRCFPDEREVLFAGGELEAHLVARTEAADPGARTPRRRPRRGALRRRRGDRDLPARHVPLAGRPGPTFPGLVARAAAELREVVAPPAPAVR
ncbi:helix-turn-helix domain-containing protein [Saccharothrix xinjiangensis]|uniref:Helix-turn-helix domain-containing protein n=1 Tax=Saccharothrix xinjiangensis TaxID=204798 RepID=A0ABV9Y9Y0_9PSEU